MRSNRDFRPGITWVVFSLVLFVYGGYGVLFNDFQLPGRRGWGIQLQGVASWILCAAIACAGLVLVSIVVGRHSRGFARIGTIVAWGLFCIALVMAR